MSICAFEGDNIFGAMTAVIKESDGGVWVAVHPDPPAKGNGEDRPKKGNDANDIVVKQGSGALRARMDVSKPIERARLQVNSEPFLKGGAQQGEQKPPSRVIGAGTFMRSYVPISYTLGGIPPQKDKDNRDIARWLWSQRQPPVEGCPVDLYLRGARAYNGVIPATLGYLPANGKHPPAMIAAFGFADEPEPGLLAPSADVAGVHITRLTPEGRKASVEPVKIMLGECAGKPIVLAPANDLHAIYLTEGIESGLSIFEECCVGVWAAGSAGNMPAIAAALPPYVKYVRIIAHHDKPTPAHPKDGGAGFAFAHQAARICELKKIEVEVHSVG